MAGGVFQDDNLLPVYIGLREGDDAWSAPRSVAETEQLQHARGDAPIGGHRLCKLTPAQREQPAVLGTAYGCRAPRSRQQCFFAEESAGRGPILRLAEQRQCRLDECRGEIAVM